MAETCVQPSITCRILLATFAVIETLPRRATYRGGPTDASGMEAK